MQSLRNNSFAVISVIEMQISTQGYVEKKTANCFEKLYRYFALLYVYV